MSRHDFDETSTADLELAIERWRAELAETLDDAARARFCSAGYVDELRECCRDLEHVIELAEHELRRRRDE